VRLVQKNKPVKEQMQTERMNDSASFGIWTFPVTYFDDSYMDDYMKDEEKGERRMTVKAAAC